MPYDITCMWNLKFGTNEPIYETETESQTQRTDLWLPSGRWDGGGMDWEFEVGRCKLVYIYMMDKQQGPNVQHRELYSISCDKP